MIRINLLPVREERRKADLRQFAAMLVGSLVLSLAVAAVFHLQLRGRVQHTKTVANGIQRQIDRFQPQLEQVKKYRKTKQRIEKKLGVIRELERRRSGPVRMLDELATHSPEKLWLTRMEAHGRRVKLHGLSLANELVASFMEALGHSPHFTDVELRSTNATKKRGLKLNEFSISASLVSPKGGEGRDVKQTAAVAVPAGRYGR